MELTRRGFLQVTGCAAASIALAQLGFDLKSAYAYTKELKIEGAKEVITICGFCSVCCNIIVHVKDGKVINTEGDPAYPVSEGALCAKGAATFEMINSNERLLKPLYRAPYSDKWEEKSWDWMLSNIAQRYKDVRDKDFIAKNAKGQEVNRVESLFHLGSSQMDNEELAVLHQMIRNLGIVHFDHQARI